MADLMVGKTNVTRLIGEHMARQKNGKWVFMLEVPEENYFDVNTETVKVIMGGGYRGLYISLHRPYQNLVSRLKEKGIDTDGLVFIDAASSQAGEKLNETDRCSYVSKELNVDELTRAVYKMLEKIKDGDKFLFLDSITTLVLYLPLSESLRFAEFLSRELTKKEVKGVVVNVAKGLSQKKFIKDIMLHADEIIQV